MIQNIFYIIIFILVGLAIYYAIAKEREELGCYRMSIGRQCVDDESVYVKNTRMEKDDTCDDLINRMTSIISYHEKGGVWRRCLILSLVSSIFIFIVSQIYKENKDDEKIIFYYLSIIVVNFCIIYFYHNYINYHHFRLLKRNGKEILKEFKNKCFKS